MVGKNRDIITVTRVATRQSALYQQIVWRLLARRLPRNVASVSGCPIVRKR